MEEHVQVASSGRSWPTELIALDTLDERSSNAIVIVEQSRIAKKHAILDNPIIQIIMRIACAFFIVLRRSL